MATQTLSILIRLITLLFLLTTLHLEARTISKTFDVSGIGTLDLKTDAGRLEIDTHNRNQVLVEVYIDGKNSDDFNLEHKTSGNDVIITGKVDKHDGWGWSRNLKVEYKVTVPTRYNLDVHTSGGSIEIEDITGDVEAHTSGGSITVGNITGDVVIKTSGGSITTDAIIGELNAHTSGGSIRVTIAKQINKDAELSTSGGSITAFLLQDIQLDIDASTSGGRINSDFDIDGRIKKQSVRGKINGGGPTLELHTSGGSININSL